MKSFASGMNDNLLLPRYGGRRLVLVLDSNAVCLCVQSMEVLSEKEIKREGFKLAEKRYVVICAVIHSGRCSDWRVCWCCVDIKSYFRFWLVWQNWRSSRRS